MSAISKPRRKSTTRATRKSSMRLTSSRISNKRSLTFSGEASKVKGDREVKEYDPCGSGPNFYQKVFGPTADESLLVGLQTVISLCEECPPESAASSSVTPSSETGSSASGSSATSADSPRTLTDEDDNEVETEINKENNTMVQIAPFASVSPIDPPSSDSSQTAPLLLNKCCSNTGVPLVCGTSQTDYCCCHACAQTQGPICQVTYSQTENFLPEDKPSPKYIDESTDPEPGQTCCYCPKVSQPVKSKASKVGQGKDSSDSCCCCVGTESEESPVSCCYCSDPTPQSKSKSSSVKKSTLKPSSLCSCCRSTVGRDTTTTSSKRCTCNTSKTIPKRQVTMCDCHKSNSSSGVEEVEENSMEMGDRNDACVRYAITKISKFCSYTTFEVMKSTSKKPKVMPKTLEGVFVLKNCSCAD